MDCYQKYGHPPSPAPWKQRSSSGIAFGYWLRLLVNRLKDRRQKITV
jgi:hypothetical protein